MLEAAPEAKLESHFGIPHPHPEVSGGGPWRNTHGCQLIEGGGDECSVEQA